MGTENYLGYQALSFCEIERAYALARAGTLSRNPVHRLVGFWLEAIVAVEEGNTGFANSRFEILVELDPDVINIQQAAEQADQALMEIRSERKALGLAECD
jgi:hypothetical protein